MVTQIIIAIITGLVSGIGSSILTSWLQHRYWRRQHREQRQEERRSWKLQRADEVRLAAIGEFNRVVHVFLAARITGTGDLGAEWLRDLNICASTIHALFSKTTYEAAKRISDRANHYGWNQLDLTQRRRAADDLADIYHEALRTLYREVMELEEWQPGRRPA
jgi:hypothetical protein